MYVCIFFGQNCLHLTFEAYLSRETYSRKYEKCQIWLSMQVKISRKNNFVENVWPANLALFIYVSTCYVEKVKKLYYSSYSQLTGWCRCSASALGARGPALNSRLRQWVLCLIFCFVVIVFYFFVQKHFICHKILIFILKCLFIKYA